MRLVLSIGVSAREGKESNINRRRRSRDEGTGEETALGNGRMKRG